MGNACHVCSKEVMLLNPLDKLKKTSKSEKIKPSLPPENRPKRLTDFHIIKMLGTGAFGRVFLCQDCKTKKFYAMKMLQKKKCRVAQISKERLLMEKKILLESRHPRIVKMYFSFQDEKYFYFVMEYLEGGPIKKYINPKLPREKKNPLVKFYAAQVLEGLLYLHHEKKIIYRDLKSENILLNHNGEAKLSDFGLAKEGEAGVTFCGTKEYAAPEIFGGRLTRPGLYAQCRPLVLRLFPLRALHWIPALYEPL